MSDSGSTPATTKAKAKPPAKRPERVGVKRGPYRPRTKPNWNKDILAKERAEKKRLQKLEKKAARVKPAKIKPLPPLTSLPVEVLDLIVSSIIPAAHPLADELPHPSELPYPPLSSNVTAGLKARSERWGSVPQNILDILNFGRCSRQTMYAVQRVIGGLGGSTKDMGTSTLDDVRSNDKRQLFLRISHCGESGDDLMAIASRSRSTLEHLVFHHCGAEHGTLNNAGQRDPGEASPMNRTKPLQSNQPKDYIPLPRLRSVQIGPDVCAECAQACLVLLGASKFHCKTGYGAPDYVLTRLYSGYNGWASTNFDSVAAPALEAVQVHIANPSAKSRQHSLSYSSLFERVLDKPLREQIKTFSLILPANERKWGGFGVGGHSSSVHQETKEEVEKALAERARADIVAPGLSNRQRGIDVEAQAEAAKAKFALLAKPAVVRPIPTPTREATRAVAVALVSSIQPIKPKSPLTLADIPTLSASSSSAGSQPSPRPIPRISVDTKSSNYDRQAIANQVKRHEQFVRLLADTAATFPNVVTLQVLRRGNARVDIVEGVMPIEDYASIYVNPLRRLHKLEHLDLGLAVVGRREVRDFPLGFVLPEPGTDPVLALEIETRRRIFGADIAHAVREGDAWRKLVLQRFVLGTGKKVEGDGFAPANLAAAEEQGELPTGWPRGLRGGFVYSADLKQRATHRGVLTSWRRGMDPARVLKGGPAQPSQEGLILAKSLIVL